MAKRKEAVKETATNVASSDTRAADLAANLSPAPAPQAAEKTPKEKVVPKPKLETKTVCFTDQDSGKMFCGDMTEVKPSKDADKVSGTKKKARSRR